MSKVAVIGNTARAIGAVVHIQSHGYRPAARLTPLLRTAGREDVIVAEAPAPTHAARIDGTVVTPKGLRKGIRIATVPAARSDEALAVLRPLFPDFRAAASVLATGLGNLNLIVPCVQLAEQAGIAVPLHRGFAEILGALLGVDPWRCGPSLKDMDLQGSPEAVKKRVLG
jgi:hypothetical protein